MLWYKGWLETRIRFVLALGFMCFLLVLMNTRAGVGTHPASAVVPFMSMNAVWVCAFLAGAGIATQPAFQASKGLHGSMLFTLSMPVSRLRLVAVRASVGWIESTTLIGLSCIATWLITPALRATVTGPEMLEYAGTLVACSLAIYLLSVLLGTFLDEQWRIWGTLLAFLALGWASGRSLIPSSFDLLRAMRDGSPLIAHSVPWTSIAASVGLGAIFFIAALKIARSREY
jgi:hypothetical protein